MIKNKYPMFVEKKEFVFICTQEEQQLLDFLEEVWTRNTYVSKYEEDIKFGIVISDPNILLPDILINEEEKKKYLDGFEIFKKKRNMMNEETFHPSTSCNMNKLNYIKEKDLLPIKQYVSDNKLDINDDELKIIYDSNDDNYDDHDNKLNIIIKFIENINFYKKQNIGAILINIPIIESFSCFKHYLCNFKMNDNIHYSQILIENSN